MNKLIEHISYDKWANLRLLGVASGLDHQDFIRAMPGSFPSIHLLFVHLLWAECLWYERWQGRTFVARVEASRYPTAQSLLKSLNDIHDRQHEYLARLPVSAADRRVSYVNFSGQRWEYALRDMVQHLVVHSAYHRGQLVTMFRQLSVLPPTTDFLAYLDSESRSTLQT